MRLEDVDPAPHATAYSPDGILLWRPYVMMHRLALPALVAAALFLSACTSSTPRPAPCPQCNASETCVQVCVDDAGAVAPECVTKVSDGSYKDRAGKAVRDCSGF